MASILLLLLSLLSTTISSTAITLPPSQSPISTPSLLPLPPPQSPQLQPLLLPPPPLPPSTPPHLPPLNAPPPTNHLQENHQDSPHLQLNITINTIFTTFNFTPWTNLLSQTSATVFIPNATATSTTPPPPSNFSDPLLFNYHIIPLRFSFSQLLLFPTGARLPTLLTGKTLLITNNSAANFTINGVPLTHPDLYQNAVVSVHGIYNFLDYTLYGSDDAPPQEPPEMVEITLSPLAIEASEIAVNRTEQHSPESFQSTEVSSPPVIEFPAANAASLRVVLGWMVVLSALFCEVCWVGFRLEDFLDRRNAYC